MNVLCLFLHFIPVSHHTCHIRSVCLLKTQFLNIILCEKNKEEDIMEKRKDRTPSVNVCLKQGFTLKCFHVYPLLKGRNVFKIPEIIEENH